MEAETPCLRLRLDAKQKRFVAESECGQGQTVCASPAAKTLGTPAIPPCKQTARAKATQSIGSFVAKNSQENTRKKAANQQREACAEEGSSQRGSDRSSPRMSRELAEARREVEELRSDNLQLLDTCNLLKDRLDQDCRLQGSSDALRKTERKLCRLLAQLADCPAPAPAQDRSVEVCLKSIELAAEQLARRCELLCSRSGEQEVEIGLMLAQLRDKEAELEELGRRSCHLEGELALARERGGALEQAVEELRFGLESEKARNARDKGQDRRELSERLVFAEQKLQLALCGQECLALQVEKLRRVCADKAFADLFEEWSRALEASTRSQLQLDESSLPREQDLRELAQLQGRRRVLEEQLNAAIVKMRMRLQNCEQLERENRRLKGSSSFAETAKSSQLRPAGGERRPDARLSAQSSPAGSLSAFSPPASAESRFDDPGEFEAIRAKLAGFKRKYNA